MQTYDIDGSFPKDSHLYIKAKDTGLQQKYRQMNFLKNKAET